MMKVLYVFRSPDASVILDKMIITQMERDKIRLIFCQYCCRNLFLKVRSIQKKRIRLKAISARISAYGFKNPFWGRRQNRKRSTQ
jgi:hypothetical protein